ncbi:MAG: hypothetical protein M9899_09885 [Bdellovibrionaceae bacterium]|nr:hypothetical protein [Pseudobdellovibrionaceae bacterium]
MMKTVNALCIGILMLGVWGCKTAEKQSGSATPIANSDNTAAGGTEYGVCAIKIEEQTMSPKNSLFLSMNPKMKCGEYQRCYHMTLEGTCDVQFTPVIYVEAQERNTENFSPNPEKNGSYRFKKNAPCVDGTFRVGVWLQLKGTDSFEVKTKHFQSLKALQADTSDYVMMNTSLFQPDFDAGTGEVKGFTDSSSTYKSKLSQCRRKFPTTYLKQRQ